MTFCITFQKREPRMSRSAQRLLWDVFIAHREMLGALLAGEGMIITLSVSRVAGR